MNWLLTAGLCVLLMELALRLPFGAAVSGAQRSSVKALRVLPSKAVSDHWKEKALAAYARATFLSSIKLAVLLGVLLACAAGLIAALQQMSAEFQSFLFDWPGLVFSLFCAGIYAALRSAIGHAAGGHGRL